MTRGLGNLILGIGGLFYFALVTSCLVVGVMTLFFLHSDGSTITGIPNRFIGIPMILCCPAAGLPAAPLMYFGFTLRGGSKV